MPIPLFKQLWYDFCQCGSEELDEVDSPGMEEPRCISSCLHDKPYTLCAQTVLLLYRSGRTRKVAHKHSIILVFFLGGEKK